MVLSLSHYLLKGVRVDWKWYDLYKLYEFNTRQNDFKTKEKEFWNLTCESKFAFKISLNRSKFPTNQSKTMQNDGLSPPNPFYLIQSSTNVKIILALPFSELLNLIRLQVQEVSDLLPRFWQYISKKTSTLWW